MFRLFAIAAVLLAAPAFAADITIDAKVTGNVVVLQAKTDGKVVVWIVPDGLAQPVPPDAFKDTKTCVIMGKPGTYKVTAISAIADKPIFGDTTFKLSGDAPQPDIPPAPLPVDDLPARLKAAYAAETSLAKRGQLVNIAAIYSAMADAALDKDIVTSQQLLDVLNRVKNGDGDKNKGMLLEGVLMELRRLITAEVAPCIGPAGPTPFDRAKVAACFKRIVKSLPTPE